MIDETDLVAYLTGKGIQVHRSAGAEVQIHCLWCPDGDPKGKGRLYLNTQEWLYHCFRCDASGNRKTLLEHFGDDDGLTYAKGADPMIRRRILTEAAELAHEMLLGNEHAMQYWLDRGIAPELIVSMKLGYVPKNFGLSASLPSRSSFTNHDLIGAGVIYPDGGEFFNDTLTIPYFSHGQIVQIRPKKINGVAKTMAGDSARVYNMDSLLAGADTVLVVEGEADTLSVLSHSLGSGDRELESMAVVGLPGANSWPDGFLTALERCERVFIGFDPDETGKKAAAKLKTELNTTGRIVRLPEGEPKMDWNAWFKRSTRFPEGHTWQDLKDLLIEADLAGKTLFSIADAAAKWRKRQVEAPGMKLGFASLDSFIRPGLKPGQVMVPLARTGVGKSIVLSNIVHNLRREPVLFISLELTAAEVFEHLRRIHAFWFPTHTPAEMLAEYPYLHIVEKNRLGQGSIGLLITEYERLMGRTPRLVIVDYLQYYARGFTRGTSQYDRVSDAIMELKAEAKDAGAGIIVPSQVHRGTEAGRPLTMDDARDAGTIEETADFVVSLYRPDTYIDKNADPDNPPMQNGHIHSGLLKSRHGNNGRVVKMRTSLMSLVVVDAISDAKVIQRIETENRLSRQGLHYEDYRRQQIEEASRMTLPLQGVS